jgi:cation:H+ antiporter
VWMDLGFLVGGLILLFLGGESLVRGSVAIAEWFGFSKLVVGLVIVGFGTSAPELLVSIQAAFSGSPDIAIGNVVGTNIANILLVLGVAALIAPIVNGDRRIRRDVTVMAGASAALVACLMYGTLSRLIGAAMLGALALYLAITYRSERKRKVSAFAHEAEEVEDIPLSVPLAGGAAVLGLILLVVGARIMVDGATNIARSFGVSEAVIGLTVVAVGTSLPELATAIVASLRRHADVVLANVIGSSIFNILAILGITAVFSPIPVSERFAMTDGPIMLGVALAAVALLFAAKIIGRSLGAFLLAAYTVYILMQVPI